MRATKREVYTIRKGTWISDVFYNLGYYKTRCGTDSVYQTSDLSWYISGDESCTEYHSAQDAIADADKRYYKQLKKALRRIKP